MLIQAKPSVMKPDETVNNNATKETVSQIFLCSPVSKILVVYALFFTRVQQNNFTLYLLVSREPLSSMHCNNSQSPLLPYKCLSIHSIPFTHLKICNARFLYGKSIGIYFLLHFSWCFKKINILTHYDFSK